MPYPALETIFTPLGLRQLRKMELSVLGGIDRHEHPVSVLINLAQVEHPNLEALRIRLYSVRSCGSESGEKVVGSLLGAQLCAGLKEFRIDLECWPGFEDALEVVSQAIRSKKIEWECEDGKRLKLQSPEAIPDVMWVHPDSHTSTRGQSSDTQPYRRRTMVWRKESGSRRRTIAPLPRAPIESVSQWQFERRCERRKSLLYLTQSEKTPAKEAMRRFSERQRGMNMFPLITYY